MVFLAAGVDSLWSWFSAMAEARVLAAFLEGPWASAVKSPTVTPFGEDRVVTGPFISQLELHRQAVPLCQVVEVAHYGRVAVSSNIRFCGDNYPEAVLAQSWKMVLLEITV